MFKRMIFVQTAGETLWSAPSNEAPFSKNAASRKGSRVVVSFLVLNQASSSSNALAYCVKRRSKK